MKERPTGRNEANFAGNGFHRRRTMANKRGPLKEDRRPNETPAALAKRTDDLINLDGGRGTPILQTRGDGHEPTEPRARAH